MINRQSFLLGALAGAATVAFAVYPLALPPAIGVIVACLWGLLALPAVLQVTAAVLIQRGQETNNPPDHPNMMHEAMRDMRYPGGAPAYREAAEDDIVDDQPDDAGDPPNRVMFESSAKAPPGWTNMASMFGGWPQPGQPPQPPQPPRTRPPERVRNGHVASQPVAQPVAQPPDNHLKIDWMADLPGLQGDPGPEPEDRPVPWLNVKPMAIDDADDDDPPDDDQVLRPLLPRRAPYPGEYEFIYEIARGAPSQNAALRSLWGYKDGRTLAWLKQVLAYYPDYEHLPIWAYEVLTADADADPVAIARRCDHITHDLASLTADLADYNIIPCPSCQRWHEAEQADLDSGILTCETCRES